MDFLRFMEPDFRYPSDKATSKYPKLKTRLPSAAKAKGLEPNGRYRIDYTNWRGERAEHTIRVLSFWFGTTPRHPEPDTMVTAIDEGEGATRTFALAGILGVSAVDD